MEHVVQLGFSPLIGHRRAASDTHGYNPPASVSFPSLIKSQNFKKTLQVSFGVGRRGGGGNGNDGNFQDFSCLHGLDLIEYLIKKLFPSYTFRSSALRLNDDGFVLSFLAGRGGGAGGEGGCGGGGGNGNGNGNDNESQDGNFDDSSSFFTGTGLLGLFLKRWRSKVPVDQQFSFIVMMENLVCVSVSVLRDMASRPNFAANLPGVVCLTHAVGLIILNLTMVYLLASISRSSWSNVPGIFRNYPKSRTFEPGAHGIRERFRMVKNKGSPFAANGFAVGLAATGCAVGLTAILNAFIKSETLKWIEDGLVSFCNLCFWFFAFIFCYF